MMSRNRDNNCGIAVSIPSSLHSLFNFLSTDSTQLCYCLRKAKKASKEGFYLLNMHVCLNKSLTHLLLHIDLLGFGLINAMQEVLVLQQDGIDFLADELLDLLRGTAHKVLGVHHLVEVVLDRRKSLVLADPLHQVIVLPFQLDQLTSSHRVFPDGFMQVLPSREK